MHILIINGPNLNLIGQRQPEVYGDRSLPLYIDRELTPLAAQLSNEIRDEIRLDSYFSNSEGDIVTRIQDASYGPDELRADAIIINAGAYSHYSLAIADALRSADLPTIEVHISNIFAREPERHHSVISPCVRGIIAGLGLDVYALALRAIIRL